MPPTVIRSFALERRLALALVICGALGALGWLWHGCVRQPEVYFLPPHAPAEWIAYPSGARASVHPRLEMGTLFKRSFTLEQAPAKASLSIAGLRHYTLLINGQEPATLVRRGRNWKDPDQFEVSGNLRAGENQIAVAVRNTNGPPVLWLALDAGGLRLNSDETWQACYGGAAWHQARLAARPKAAIPGSAICGGEEPWAGFRERWLTLLLFAVLSGAVYAFLPAFRRDLLGPACLAAFWVALFANNLGVLPNLVGYDVDGHIAYIHYIQEHHSLPRADEGWEMFQPPLYYLLGAGLLGALSLAVTQDAGVMALRVMGLLTGVGHLVLVWASLRLLFPGDRSKPRWGLLMAAVLPPVLYLSQYVSNEGLAAAMVSACVYLTLRMLRQEHISWKAWTGLGLCLGAALLTKPTALLVIPAAAGALLLRERQQEESRKQKLESRNAEGTSPPLPHLSRFTHHASRITLLLTLCLAVCGWHYARLWMQYGNPLIGVWDPRLGFSWWQDDGYRTGGFYLRFGAVLAHPWFSSFRSFADGLYATLWGDGLLGGMADAVARPPWNYDLMAAGYWLALLPMLAVAAGAVLALAKFLRQPSAEWFLLLGLAFLAGLALVHMSISLPYQCHVKAFYGLCALVPLCACGAWGLDALCRRSGKLRPVICILFGLWAINSYAAFWIPRSTVAAQRSRAHSLWKEHRQPEAVESLKAGLARDPNPGAEAQAFLAYLLMETGETQEAARLVAAALQQDPDEPKGHMVTAAILTREQRFDEAIEHARRAVELAPDSESAYEQLASLLIGRGRTEEGIAAAREGLAAAPFSAELRFDLGTALALRGETAEGIEQLQLACGIKPKWAEPRFLLGSTLAKQGRLEEACQCLREGLRLEPGNAGGHCQLAAALSGQHETAGAIAHFGEALRLQPDFAEALNNLAWIRAAHSSAGFRDGAEAVRLGERACKITQFKEPVMVGTLAVAYAEAGRFDEAVATARKARELALAAGQQGLADENQKLIQFFSARQPYRDPAQP